MHRHTEEQGGNSASDMDRFRSNKNRKVLTTAFICIVIAATIALWFPSRRNQSMERLYDEAAMRPGYWRGSAESVAAVRKLASYSGRRSSMLLLDLALGQDHRGTLPSEVQVEAIRALQSRTEPEIPAAIASLLQPHTALDIRLATAQTLQSLPCKGECIRSILHYLERVRRGEPNFEDMIVPATSISKGDAEQKQKDLYDKLHSVLRREEGETIVALHDIYGIGSGNPSPFALELVSLLQLTHACPLLIRSNSELSDLPPQLIRGPRQELHSAISSLNCK